MMYNKALFILVVLLVTGCASKPDYRAAKGSGYGYTETQYSDTQYRVTFKARGSDKTKAMDYAMYRAAELTINNGYDWFIVSDRETLVDRKRDDNEPRIAYTQRYERETRCGLVSCRTTYYPSRELAAGIFIGGSERSEIESTINIEMGKGTRPANMNSYDARILQQNLAPKK